jgi:HTH-type transcriptional regulator/antitoxin HipB
VDYPIRVTDQLRVHLRALRQQRGLTQAQLGQKLGIGQVRVAEIEAKPGLVSVDRLAQLMSALGVTLVLRDLTDNADPSAARAEVATAHSPVRRMPQATPAKPASARAGRKSIASSTLPSATGDKRPPPSGAPPATKSTTENPSPLRIPPGKGSW